MVDDTLMDQEREEQRAARLLDAGAEVDRPSPAEYADHADDALAVPPAAGARPAPGAPPRDTNEGHRMVVPTVVPLTPAQAAALRRCQALTAPPPDCG